MKKIILILLCVVILFSFVGCSEKDKYVGEPDITRIRTICNLATLECYYHNVAKSTKTAGSSITDWFEKDREFWIEYTGVAKIGIDMERSDDRVLGEAEESLEYKIFTGN